MFSDGALWTDGQDRCKLGGLSRCGGVQLGAASNGKHTEEARPSALAMALSSCGQTYDSEASRSSYQTEICP